MLNLVAALSVLSVFTLIGLVEDIAAHLALRPRRVAHHDVSLHLDVHAGLLEIRADGPKGSKSSYIAARDIDPSELVEIIEAVSEEVS